MKKPPTTYKFPRNTLVMEIDRRCSFPDCGGRNQIGLTKSEAIEYRGFDCAQCERWNDNRLNDWEIPKDWLDQVKQTQSYLN